MNTSARNAAHRIIRYGTCSNWKPNRLCGKFLPLIARLTIVFGRSSDRYRNGNEISVRISSSTCCL
ncbi:hypothetical protein D3C83_220100 [compost metagenome]